MASLNAFSALSVTTDQVSDLDDFVDTALASQKSIDALSSGYIDVTLFGIEPTPASVDVMDSNESASFVDNATALIALRDQLATIDADREWTLFFPGNGVYQYSNNRWLWGLRNVNIKSDGASLQCIYQTYSAYDSSWFSRNDTIFTHTGDRIGAGGTAWDAGYLIDTVSVGDTTITLKTEADGSTISVGDEVLVHSFSQQVGGYSPNLRYYEWATVTAKNGDTLTLSGPLMYEHRDDYVDHLYDNSPIFGQSGVVSFGKARVIPLTNRARYVGTYNYHNCVWIDGVKLLPNPYSLGSSQGFTISSRRFKMTRCELVGEKSHLFVRECEHATIDDVDIGGSFEPDKIVGTLRIKDVRIKGHDSNNSLRSSTGVRSLIVDNVYGAHRFSAAPRRIDIRGGRFSSLGVDNYARWAPIDFALGVWPVEEANIVGPELFKLSAQSSYATGQNTGEGGSEDFLYYTIASITDPTTLVDSATSYFIDRVNPGTHAETMPVAARAIAPGWVLLDLSGSEVARVKHVIGNGDTYEVVLASGAVSLGLDIKWRAVQRLVVNGTPVWTS